MATLESVVLIDSHDLKTSPFGLFQQPVSEGRTTTNLVVKGDNSPSCRKRKRIQDNAMLTADG